eukprot:SAG31_NODE_6221_length_2113_cov_13.879841_1_plen_588_part_10
MVILGHAGNVVPGVHWEGSKFAATPSIDAGRIHVAICVLFKWAQRFFDACTAFLHALCRDSEKSIVRFPPELRQFDPDTGEELLGLLERAAYGHPIASIRWSETRDEFILTFFNSNGWSCIRLTDREPCMFLVLGPDAVPGGSQPPRSDGAHKHDSAVAAVVDKMDVASSRDHRILMCTHTDGFRIGGDRPDEVQYVIDAMKSRFGIKMVDSGIMLGIRIDCETDSNGVYHCTLTQSAYIAETYSMFEEFMPKNYKVCCPFPKDQVGKPPVPVVLTAAYTPEEAKRNLDRFYRTGIGRLYWIYRNTKAILGTGLALLSRVLHAPSDVAFSCMLHAICWAYQDRDKGIRFSSNKSPVPISWYDATNKEDVNDSLALGGGIHMMMGGAISFFSGKHKHVGMSGSTHCEYMALERNTRTTVWLRALLESMQIFRATGLVQGTMNFGKLTRLCNETSLYRDATSKCDLKWITRHDGVDYGEIRDDIVLGKWAIITELGTGDILAIADDVSPPQQHGPAADTVCIIPDHDGVVDQSRSQVHVYDAFGFAEFVKAATIVIGDNITALKWASVDAVTPNNKHIRTIYHWLREHIR